VIGASSYLVGQATGFGARSVRAIPLGVDIPARIVDPVDPPHVLYVGRLSPEKGILEFLEATSEFPRVVVGDGPLRARIPEAVGFVPHERVRSFYERAAVVCVPSRREGYGVVAREAMACGRPVVASAVGGLREAVADGVTGLLVPPEDPAALRDAIARLLADPELRAQLGSKARLRAESDYSWSATIDSLLQVYENACVAP
jgi:glycosyltransferase involved in cell wall biosynthesis